MPRGEIKRGDVGDGQRPGLQEEQWAPGQSPATLPRAATDREGRCRAGANPSGSRVKGPYSPMPCLRNPAGSLGWSMNGGACCPTHPTEPHCTPLHPTPSHPSTHPIHLIHQPHPVYPMYPMYSIPSISSILLHPIPFILSINLSWFGLR